MNRSKHNRVIVAQGADWGKEARARRKLGYIAEQLDLPKQELVAEARRRGVEPDWSDELFDEELSS
jgi:hypothetical protein